jgi:DnaJ-class molecular chaperone
MAEPDQQMRECPPCRGTGSVVSGEGGNPHPVTCPWCDGSGQVPAVTPKPE